MECLAWERRGGGGVYATLSGRLGGIVQVRNVVYARRIYRYVMIEKLRLVSVTHLVGDLEGCLARERQCGGGVSASLS